ncbi:MAG: PKD domain-containing protein [Saprospiraceae bacterium]|nr:PKD domain-containing protein [Saprospiraceae bacterium]
MKNIFISLQILFSALIIQLKAQDLVLHNDTICINEGEPLNYNVLLNDVIPQGFNAFAMQLGQWDPCFRLNDLGILTLFPQPTSCCGEYDLPYKVTAFNSTGEMFMAEALINIIIKCPKPNCSYIELVESDTGGSPNPGGQGKTIFYACQNNPVTYYVNYIPANIYTWTLGPGGASIPGMNNAEIIVTWTNPGPNTVTLVTNNGVTNTTQVFCIEVLPAPVASFTKSASTVCLNSPISFYNNSSGASSYYWDFGDGNNSMLPNPTHNYGTAGTYTVTLFAYSSNFDPQGNPLCCCVDSMQMQVIVDDKPGPNIYWISTMCEGDSSCYWTDALNCTLTWTVKDANGTPITFTGQGTDTICVVWNSGPFGTITLQLSNCSPNIYCTQPVTATVPVISSVEVIKGKKIVCAGSKESYSLPKWPGVIYNWQVTGGMVVAGNGTHDVTIMWANGPTGTIHVDYGSPFLAGLPGHEEGDCYGVADLTVHIKPKFELLPTPTIVCVGTTSFLSTNVSPPLGFTWTTNPSLTGFPMVGVNNVSINWPNTGTFKICVYPNNPAAFCNDTICTFITVVGMPLPDSISGQKIICPNQTYTYFANSSQNNVSFNWTVTGGTPSTFTGDPISITWNNTGPYSISLTQTGLSSPFCTSLPIVLNITKKALNGPLTLSLAPLCTNSTQTYTCGPLQDPSAVYTWSVLPVSAGSVVGGQGSNSAMIQWNNTPGPVILKCKVSLCSQMDSIMSPLLLTAPISPTIVQSGNLCPGNTGTLTLTGGTFFPINWSSGQTTPSITISAAGSYVVTTTDVNMCTAVTTYVANNIQGPNASISSPDVLSYCVLPNISQPGVNLVALTNPNYSYQWYCNASPVGTNSPTFFHTSNAVPGSFTYYVVVTDVMTNCFKQSNNIIVNQLNCVGGPGNGCTPQNYNVSITPFTLTPLCNIGYFNVSSSANVTLTSWNFGDIGGNTNTGTLQNAVHPYSTAGCYLATLYFNVLNSDPMQGPCGLSQNTSICIPVAADFDIDLVTCRTYNFTNLSSYLPGNTISSYYWTFGDGNFSTMQHPSHTYTLGGTYTVTLTVTTSTGCQAQWTAQIIAPSDPVVSYTKVPNPACVGEAVQFTPAFNPAIISYFWDFGDGSNNAAMAPSHSYLTSGTFPTSLMVVDNNNCSNTLVMPLMVHPVFMPDTIVYTPSLTVCFGNAVTLTAPTGSSFVWNNGMLTQIITVNASGWYSVTVTDVNGCTAVPDSVEVIVLPQIIAQIAGPKTICDNNCITLSATQGFGYTYQWFDKLGNPLAGETNPTLQICANTYQDSVYVQITQMPSNCIVNSAWWEITLATSPSVVINVISGNLCAGSPSLLMAVATPPVNVAFSWSTGATGASIIAIQQGTYTVYATDTISGCSSSAFVNVNPLPDLCILPTGCYEACNPDTICGPAGLSAYQWNMNGIPIPGATNQCYIVTQSGSYSLKGTNSFGCMATSDTLILVLIPCCDEDDTEITATPVDPTSPDCCYFLNYFNSQDSLMSMVISTNDADINAVIGSVLPPFSILGTTANSVTLANITPGTPLPKATIPGFIKICAKNITNSPVVINISWNWPEYSALCQDSVILDCEMDKECVFILEDEIICNEDGGYQYTVTICNPIDNTFPFGFIDLTEIAPPGVIVSPGFYNLGTPIPPGGCQTFVFLLTGPNLPNQQFCFNMVVHENNPLTHPNSLCCSLDSIYCIHLPGCNPCDSVYVEAVLPTEEDSCCYNIVLNNYHDNNTYVGVQICSLTPGTLLNLNNNIGSGWTTVNYSPTNFILEYTAGYMPISSFTLPQICVAASDVAFSDIEIKWLEYHLDGYITLCSDTVQFFCPGDCGYYDKMKVTCIDNTNYNIQFFFNNTSNDTIYSASLFFSDPALATYSQNIPLPSILPGGSFGPINIIVGPPAVIGDTLCLITTLHNKPSNLSETCCQFKTVIVLPLCDTGSEPCACDENFETEVLKGFSVMISGNTVIFQPLGELTDCDQVVWDWLYNNTSTTSYGNNPVDHTFPAKGEYKVCMTVIRTTPDGKQCKVKYVKEVKIGGLFNLTIHPNPGFDIIQLKIGKQENISEAMDIQIMDLNGKISFSGKVIFDENGLDNLDVSNLPNGIYIIKIFDNEQFTLKKFIKIN